MKIESRCVRPVAMLNNIRKKKKYSKEKMHILMLGNICERKNQLMAIKVCELCIIGGIQIELTIAGSTDGIYAQKCMQYIKEHNLQNNVFFKGFVSNIVPLLEYNDCLLCTSIDESFPSSIVEALTYDLTIISTPIAGVPEIFQNKENAFISKDFLIDSIYTSLLECIDSYNNGSIDQIHKNAERTWRDNFEREKVKGQINEFYLQIYGEIFHSNNDFNNIMPEVKRTVNILSSIYKNCDEMQKRALYHTKLRKELPHTKMYLWGAGKMGAYAYKILSMICPGLNIIAFVDRNREGCYLGLPIIKIEEMPIDKSCLYGIAFINGIEEAINFFDKKDLHLNKQVWIVP